MRTPILVAVVLLAGIALQRWANLAIAQPREEGDVVAGAADTLQIAPSPLGIYRLWSSSSDSVGQRPFSEYEALLTDRAREARAAYNERRDDPDRSCAIGMPLAMLSPTPIELIQGDAMITLRLPAHGVERIIHMDAGGATTPPATRSPLGHSIGYWDHDVLVIETTHLDSPFFDASGTPLSDQAEFIERLSVSADDSRLTYKLTTIDRVMFRGPITSELHWDWRPDVTIELSACAPDQEK